MFGCDSRVGVAGRGVDEGEAQLGGEAAGKARRDEFPRSASTEDPASVAVATEVFRLVFKVAPVAVAVARLLHNIDAAVVSGEIDIGVADVGHANFEASETLSPHHGFVDDIELNRLGNLRQWARCDDWIFIGNGAWVSGAPHKKRKVGIGNAAAEYGLALAAGVARSVGRGQRKRSRKRYPAGLLDRHGGDDFCISVVGRHAVRTVRQICNPHFAVLVGHF